MACEEVASDLGLRGSFHRVLSTSYNWLITISTSKYGRKSDECQMHDTVPPCGFKSFLKIKKGRHRMLKILIQKFQKVQGCQLCFWLTITTG